MRPSCGDIGDYVLFDRNINCVFLFLLNCFLVFGSIYIQDMTSGFILCFCDDLVYNLYDVFFQIEEDQNLLPDTTTEGYQFDPNAEIPSDGFKF